MECGGGEIAAKRSRSGSGDRLSALPDDALVLILLRLDTAAAGRTSVLARRWRRVWTLLPVLRFPHGADPHHIRTALNAHQRAIRYLRVRTVDALPESVVAWLSAASRRLTGRLIFQNEEGVPVRGSDEDSENNTKAFELPCLENVTSVNFDLGYLGLALPSAGTFAQLTKLFLIRVRLHGPLLLGDLVSTPRCPSLQKLVVYHASVPDNIAIRSKSLLEMELQNLDGLQQFIVDALALKELKLLHCSAQNQPFVVILAPQLRSLELSDPYDPSSIHLGNMPLLERLNTSFFLVYGPQGCASNRTILELFTQYQDIHELTFTLAFPLGMLGNYQYLMEDITMFPRITFLTLIVMNIGHAFGASLFHVLRHCTGLRSLSLHFDGTLEEQFACQAGCICDDQPMNWKTDKLLLNSLQEVEITNMKDVGHEVAFLKQLFNWATLLKNIRVVFHYSIGESRAWELHQTLSSFFGPEMSVKFYTHGDNPKLLHLLR